MTQQGASEITQIEGNYNASNPFSSLAAMSSLPIRSTMEPETNSHNPMDPLHYQHQMSIFNKQMANEFQPNTSHDDAGFRGNGSEIPSNNFGSNIDYELLSKFNRMHTQSPQLPRKNYSTLKAVNSPSPLFFQHENSQSPLMHQKIQHDDSSSHHQYQQHNPYKPLQSTSNFSPVVKKRYGTDGLVSEDLEFRILHGNTSPIVLQRFYHQTKQFHDQKLEEMRASQKPPSTNPFEYGRSHIPINHNSPSFLKYSSPSPTPQRNTNYYEPNASPPQHYVPQQYPRNGNGHGNGNGSGHGNGNGTMQYRQHYHHLNMQSYYENNSSTRPPIPNSPQLDRLRANLEKPNFYERHQMPVDVHVKDNMTGSPTNNGVSSNDKSKGEIMKSLMKQNYAEIAIHYQSIYYYTHVHTYD